MRIGTTQDWHVPIPQPIFRSRLTWTGRSSLAAMQTAERNIEERRDDLNSAYRRKRQETITRELLDVVSGFEAVSSSDS